MEQKTRIKAEDNQQEIIITRTFELPVELLYKAYAEAEFIEQWMGNKVLKLDHHDHGSYIFEKKDDKGNVLFRANGVIHKVIENRNITRTFEMENTPFPVQLEFLDFESIDEEHSSLSMKIVYRSVEDRDQMLKLPFAYGVNMAHNQLEKIFKSK